MDSSTPVVVKMFGALHTLRRSRGLDAVERVSVPPDGLPAADVALKLELPLEQIEAVFHHHKACDLGERILPGDEIAFVPRGTPGPHRFCLGIYAAGTGEKEPSGQ